MNTSPNLDAAIRKLTRAWEEWESQPPDMGVPPSDEVLAALIHWNEEGGEMINQVVTQLDGVELSDCDVEAIWDVAIADCRTGVPPLTCIQRAALMRIWLRRIQAQSSQQMEVVA